MSRNHELRRADERELARAMLNRPLSSGGLAIATTASQVKTASTVNYLVDGAFKSQAAADNNDILSGEDLGNSEKCLFLITLDAGGNFNAVQSAVVAASDDDPDLPAVPADEVPIGWGHVETDASNTFTPGTTDLNATGVTTTFTDAAWPNSGASALGY